MVGSLEQGSAETSLLIVCFKAEGGKKSGREEFPPEEWVRGSMGPPGRVGWACRSRRNLKGQRVPSEGPAGRIRCASCRKELLHC